MQSKQIRQGAFYDPETVNVLKTALDDAWNSLVPAQQAQIAKSDMARRILKAASQGERDPVRLRATALIHQVGEMNDNTIPTCVYCDEAMHALLKEHLSARETLTHFRCFGCGWEVVVPFEVTEPLPA
jgi:hypothetical protein